MKILITNIVTLNGGDYAILVSMMNLLRGKFGDDTKFVVYDTQADIARKYHPDINYRTLLNKKYPNRFFKRFRRITHFLDVLSPGERLLRAAKLYSRGYTKLAMLLLKEEEIRDFKIYLSADMVISTGGTYLVENYSLSPKIFDYNFTLALKKPLIFFTQSLGPFKKIENKIELKNIFNQCDLILLRDEASYHHLEEIDVNVQKIKICADVVFSSTSMAILEKAKDRSINTPIKVGISVRYWKYFNSRSQEEGKGKYFNSVAAICEYVVKKLGGEVVFISTCQAIKEYHIDDSKAAKEIFELLSQKTKESIRIDEDFHTPSDFQKIVKNFDIVVSTRMHGCIQALNVGVPVLPIAYEFKTVELFEKLIDKKFILDIETIEENQAVEVFSNFINMLPKFRSSLMDKVLEQHLSAISSVDYLNDQL